MLNWVRFLYKNFSFLLPVIIPPDSTSFTYFGLLMTVPPVPVAARSKASVCVRSLSGIVGSNPTGGGHGCLS